MTLEVGGAFCLDSLGKDKKQSFKKGQIDDADVRFVLCSDEVSSYWMRFGLREQAMWTTGGVSREAVCVARPLLLCSWSRL